jgi:ATP-dependent helicase/nuclease subunit B
MKGIQNGCIEIDRRLAEEADVVFAEFQEANPVRYPVVWEILQERLLTILKSVIEADLSELSGSGFMPYCFEVDVTGYFNVGSRVMGHGSRPSSLTLDPCPMTLVSTPPGSEGEAGLKEMHDIPLHGVLDRIDIQPDTGLFRIIDYKFKAGTTAKSEDKNLILSAIRGRRLQPPMYILMAIPYLGNTYGVKNPLPDRVSFYYIAPNWPNSPNWPNWNDGKEMGANRAGFPGDCWQSDLGEKIKATAILLLQGIRDGLYFIIPDLYCKYCDYSAICRKNHLPTRWRAERDKRVKPYYGVRENT